MKKNKVRISVVMPIYNVEKYLEESLESVLCQTFQEFELICVDDGSTDNCGKILDNYALKDERIVVIHKKNTGYGNSMNVGMAAASGEYIAILEPDDQIKENMLEDLYELAKTYQVNFVKSDYAVMYGEKESRRISPVKIIYDKELYGTVLNKQKLQYLYDGRIAHWTGLYRTDFLRKNNIVFHETAGASYQDIGFWFQTIFYAETVYLTDNYYYCYRQDNPNASVRSKEKVYCICKEYDFVYEKLKNEDGFMEYYLPWFIKSRYASYQYTLERIADEYKWEFLLYMSDELNRWKEKQMLDLKQMNEWDKNQLLMILKNPKSVYEKRKNMKINFNKVFQDDMDLYIYGAGDFAEKAYVLLSEKNKKRFCGFVVTEKKEKQDFLFEFPIYTYAELHRDKERQILIGVSQLYKEKIKEILLQANEKNIIEFPYEILG